VTLGWTASNDNVAVTGYRILRNTVPLGTTAQLSFTDGGRTPSTVYQYTVEAMDAAGNYSDPAALTVTTPADLQAPTVPGSLTGFAGDGSAAISWNTSTDNVAVTGYRVYRGNVLLTTVATPGFSDSGLVNGTACLYAVTAIDAAGNESAAANVSVTPEQGGTTGAAILRVNCGNGGAYVDPQGNAWSADFGANNGTVSNYTNAISGTNNPKVYQSRRTVSSSVPLLTYELDVPDGNYRVVLHFVEVTSGFSVGSRVFDILAEDVLKVDNLDIFSRVGSFAACVVEFPVTVTDGHLDLSFPKVASNPTISGIEVFEVLPPSLPPTFEQWLAARGLAGMTAADSDSGGLDNLAEYELQFDPNDPVDDAGFRLKCEKAPGGMLITLPELKPLGNYHLHRGTDLAGLANPANRIATITRSSIEAMSPAQRSTYSVNDGGAGSRAFYQLYFEAAAE
jgi:large repetitive protein